MCCARAEAEVSALVTEIFCAFDHFDSATRQLIVLSSNVDVFAALPSSQIQTPPPSLLTKELARYGGTRGLNKLL
jgi:hypothetical protein